MKRKEKRVKKYRGSSNHGCGNAKNRRGSGNRGGVGNAGLNKQKKTWTVKYDPEHFGNHGFASPNRKQICTLNIFEIENMAKANRLEKKEGRFLLNFKGKILGCGYIKIPVNIYAQSWSKKAEEKIKQAGGSIEQVASKS